MIRTTSIKNGNFLERSALSALSFVKNATLYEEFAVNKGFLQSLEPRIKTIVFLFFLITAVCLKSAIFIALLYLLCLTLAFCSGVPIIFFLVRTWVFIPIFSLCIVIPSLFSFVSGGQAIASFHALGIKFIITRQGLDGAVLFVARIATSVSLVVLLSLTTRHGELLKVLRNFKVPQVFVLTVSMCYRYLYLFAVIIENIFIAIKSRVGIVSHHGKGQHIVAWNIANTYNKSTQLSEDVYKAMLSRGYSGEPRLLEKFHPQLKDWFCLIGSVIVSACLFYMELRK
ncbi:MAG: cobalt ECF transporter T component CbiQ [Candidatus Omnitrophica bacterium]|nr:cobalt ECF transporter T component CbiQ [Candidatus Omnitrophota bacterium]